MTTPATPRAALLDLADRIASDPHQVTRYPNTATMLRAEAARYADKLPTSPPPVFEIPTEWAHLTQERVDHQVKTLYARYWEAEDAQHAVQDLADTAQEAADAALRRRDEIGERTQELCDAIRKHRPDLTIPESS